MVPPIPNLSGRSLRRAILPVILSGLSATLHAQSISEETVVPNFEITDIEASVSKAPQGDFEAAFAELLKIGVPDAKGHRYVHLKLLNENTGSSYEYDPYSNSRRYKRKGNAWVPNDEKAKEAKTRKAIYNGHEIREILNQPKRGFFTKLLTGKAKDRGGKAAAEVKDIDVKDEVEGILKTLQPQDPDMLFYSGMGSSSSKNARYLLFACHLHRAGHTELGNRLASKLFSIVTHPEKLLDEVITMLAKARMQTAYLDFLKGRDWKAYHAELEKISNDFPRGWYDRKGLPILLKQVEARINDTPPRYRPVKGMPVSDEAKALVDALLTRTDPLEIDDFGLWAVTPGRLPDDPLLRPLLKLGKDALPALVAVVEDETLIPTSLEEGYYSSNYSRMVAYGSNGGAFDLSRGAYKNLVRPTTRSDVAKALLIRAIPDSTGEFNSLSASALANSVKVWWKENKDRSPGETYRAMLAGDSSSARQALNFLTSSDDPQDHEAVEKFFLSQSDFQSWQYQIQSYVRVRKKGAANFAKKLKPLLANDPEFDSEQLMKQLDLFSSDLKPADLLKKMRDGEMPLREGVTSLRSLAGEGKLFEVLPDLMPILAENLEAEGHFATINELVRWAGGREYYNESDDGSYSKTSLERIATSKAEWTKLTALKSPVTEEMKETVPFISGAPDAGAVYALVLDQIYFPAHNGWIRGISQELTTEQFYQLYQKRAAFLLEGKDDGFPDPGSVGEERFAEIKEEIIKLSAPEILSLKASLPLVERLSWPQVIAGFEEELPQGLLDLGAYVGAINFTNSPTLKSEYQDRLKALIKDKKVTVDLLTKLSELHLEIAKDDPNLVLYLLKYPRPSQSIQFFTYTVSAAQKTSLAQEPFENFWSSQASAIQVMSSQFSSNDGESSQEIATRNVPKEKKDEADERVKIIKGAVELLTSDDEDVRQAMFFLIYESKENLKNSEAESYDE